MVSSTIGTYLPFCLYGGMGGQQRADAIVCDILGDSLTTMTKQLKRSFCMPGVGHFVSLSLALRRAIINPDEKISFKVYVYL